MTDERQHFFELLDLDTEAAREAYLEGIGRRDPALRARLAGLLAANGEAGAFLDAASQPAAAASAAAATQHTVPIAEGPGTVIGRYKLLQKIGEGGFGVVYMAEQREPVRRRVALKVIKLGMDTRQVVGRFEAERQALALMDHPNIAKVLDGGATENGRPYFVMELVKGVPITEFCDEQNLNTGERLRLFLQVCAAVQHAHQKGVIHRDLKPGNVLVTLHDDRPVPKVIDFGIAKAMQQELTEITIFTRYQEFIGTPAYMSPEQAQFSGLDIDTRTDIYSLGVLLYELLTGRTPFDAKELMTGGYEEMRRRIRDEEPLKPSTRIKTLEAADRLDVARRRGEKPEQLGRSLRGDLDWIVMRALAKERARRYESAGALARDVERFLSDEPVSAAAPGAVYRLRKFAVRHRVAMSVTAAMLLLLVTGIVATSYQMIRASRAELLALRYLNEERKKAVAMEIAQGQRERAYERAEREAAISAAVVQFLNEDIFAEATPTEPGEPALAMIDLVRRAQGQIEHRFASQPLVAAAIRQTLATTLFTLGDRAAAVAQAELAYQLRREHLGNAAAETIESLTLYGWLTTRERNRPAGRELAEEAVQLATANLGRGHQLTLDAMSRLAWIDYGDAATRPAARDLIIETVDLARQSGDVKPEVFIRSLQLYGRLFKPGEGEPLFREAVAYAEGKLGRNHPRAIVARGALAGYLYDWNLNLAEAEQLVREAVRDHGGTFGPSHPNSIVFRDTLRLTLLKLGRHEEALRQGLRLLQLGEVPDPRLEMVRQGLKRTPLPPVDEAGAGRAVTWRFAATVTDRGWMELSFADATWNREPPAAATNLWLRGSVELASPFDGSLLFVLPAKGEFQIRINGVRASRAAPRRDAAGQMLVANERALRTLRPGRNLITIEARDLDPAMPPQIEVFAGPNLADEFPPASRLVENR